MIFFVLDGVDAVLQEDVIKPAYEALSAFVAAPLRSGVILLVAAHGFNLMKGHTQNLSMVDVGWLILKIAFVTELLINWPMFNELAYSTIWGTYNGLAEVMTGPLLSGAGTSSFLSSPGSIFPFSSALIDGAEVFRFDGSKLDKAFGTQLANAYSQMVGQPSFVPLSHETAKLTIPIPKIPFVGGTVEIDGFDIPIPMVFPNLIGNIAGLIKLVMTVLLFASVFVVLLLSRLGLTSCLAVAPIFIALALFQHTRSYTDAWFRGMLGFILTPMLLVLVLLVGDACIHVFDDGIASRIGVMPSVLGVIAPAIAYLILYYALAKSVAGIPQFASGLVGSMLSHVGGEAAHGLIGGMHKGIDAGVGAAKGAVSGFIKGGPAGAKLGAAQGAATAMR